MCTHKHRMIPKSLPARTNDVFGKFFFHSFFCLFFAFFPAQGNSQKVFFPSDTLNPKRLIFSSVMQASIWSGSIIGLHQVWYSEYPKTPFHTFDDSKTWLQMDKAGHVFTAYKLSRLSALNFRWAGLDRKKSAFLGAGIGWGYQFSLEMLDAQNAAWGFSWSDIAANTLGSSLFLAQDLLAESEIVHLKFSYSPSPYAPYRPAILGATFTERILKDYNGQTYWLSFSPQNWVKNSKIPAWIALAIGYSADAKLQGDQNQFTSLDGKTFHAQRQFLLSLDVNVQKLPIQKKWLKKLVSPFNSIKIPFPALILQGNKIGGSWVYF